MMAIGRTGLPLAGLLWLAGCGHSPSAGDAGPAVDLASPIDRAARPDLAAPPDAAAAPDLASPGDSAAPDDLAVPADLADPADLAGPADLATAGDLSTPFGMVTASLSNVLITENCMPIVPPDPVNITASIKITNTGNVPIGPVSVAGGDVLQNLNPIASFAAQPVQTPVLMPGQSQTLQVTKVANSVMPAKACATLPCNGGVNLAVPYAGPGIPNGNRAVSGLTFVTCVN
jgi:hypothetical protein